MAIVKQFQRKEGFSRIGLVYLVLLLITGVYVSVNRLYALRLHDALGYGSVYQTNMIFELVTQFGGALVYSVLAYYAARPLLRLLPPRFYGLGQFIIVLAGWGIGYAMWSLDPASWLLFVHHQLFHHQDPLFHLDVSFYVYDLPVLFGFCFRVLGTIILILAVRLMGLLIHYNGQNTMAFHFKLAPFIRSQARLVLALAACVFLCFSAIAFLMRYEMVLSPGNDSFLHGPGFTETHIIIPVFTWLYVAAFLAGALLLAKLAFRVHEVFPENAGMVSFVPRPLRGVWAVGAAFVICFLAAQVIGALVNSLYVHPNQNSVELPYIKSTIDETRWSLGIDHVDAKPLQPLPTLTSQDVSRDANELQNVRINDQGQTTSIYNQLQSFKNYFTFSQASVDRYGDSQVYVSARQMDVNKLPVQTWINRTLIYTHGYGIAASPVNQFDQDGLPVMWAKDTPQKTQPPVPEITRPEIYFGTTGDKVIAPSKEAEFDYPVGSSDHSSHYQGGFGLPVEKNRLLLTLMEGTLRFYTSDQITSQSLLLFDRNIYERTQDIAPFLTYDHDAFPFVDASGHILWMLDAYTETSQIPYAQTFKGIEYIRNSVKVVVDAYTGETKFYVTDPRDPMLKSLESIYPGLFTEQIPEDIIDHFRYPNDLFAIQADALTRYHMTDPASFYNQEDLWAIARQIYQQNQTAARPPVYQMIRMPDRDQPEFVISALFTPANKDNLNGWLVANNEPGRYGQLTLYQFPQSSLTFGPMQAENQIDSNPAISAQLTLWNQQGSSVIRGDLLLIPIGNTILYIEPIYLVANRQNSLPQLERVIVNFHQQVYMGSSLSEAIEQLLKGQPAGQVQPNTTQPSGGTVGKPGTGQTPLAGDVQALTKRANDLFNQYEADTAKGDFEAAGRDLKELGQILGQLANSH